MKQRRPRHHSVPRGKRVFVRLVDGLEFIDKFIDNSDKFTVFENRRVRTNQIVVFSLAKHRREPDRRVTVALQDQGRTRRRPPRQEGP